MASSRCHPAAILRTMEATMQRIETTESNRKSHIIIEPDGHVHGRIHLDSLSEIDGMMHTLKVARAWMLQEGARR